MAIVDYNAYMKELEHIYHQYGFSVSDAILWDFIVRERLDINYKINIQDLRKDLATIHRKTLAHNPTNQVSPKGKKSGIKPDMSQSGVIIRTYSEYMSALERLYIKKGKVVLSDAEIQDFIDTNKLGVVFGITKNDVRLDLQSIDKKWNPTSYYPKNKNQLNSSGNLPKAKAKLTTFKQYINALETIWIQNKKNLTEEQIARFIKDNAIDVVFGVTIADVKRDLQDIEKRYNHSEQKPVLGYNDYKEALSNFLIQNGDKAFLDIYIKKFISVHRMDSNSSDLMADIRMDLVFMQSKMPLTSATAKRLEKTKNSQNVSVKYTTDRNFEADVASMILKHKEILSKRQAIKGLLWDYFPDKKREINVLMILVNYGILDAMQSEQTLDAVFMNRFVTRIMKEYGIEREFATEMVLVWCRGYGMGLLGKN